MKIENFNLIERRDKSVSSFKYIAEVDVTTGFIFKRTERKKICKGFGGYWFFADTGKHTPGFLAEEAERAFEAKHGPLSEVDIIK